MHSATEDLGKTWIIACNVLTIYLHNARKAFSEIIKKKTHKHTPKSIRYELFITHRVMWALLFPHFLRFRNAKRTRIFQNYNTCVVGVHRGLTYNGWISGFFGAKPLNLAPKTSSAKRHLNNIKTSSARLRNSKKLFLNNLFITFIPHGVNKYFILAWPVPHAAVETGADLCSAMIINAK